MIGWSREVLELTELALAQFPHLTESELKLLCGVTTGDEARCGHPTDDKQNNPESAESWGPERVIRAELVRWLCVNRDAAKLVDPRGIQVRAARIDGVLDLSFASVEFPLSFAKCRITDRVNLRFAQLDLLTMPGTVTVGMDGDGLVVRGAIDLRDGFCAKGSVRLPSADVGGNLDCNGGKFANPGKVALGADGARVKGDVFLSDEFSADGEIGLVGVDVSGDLAFSYAHFAEGSLVQAGRANVRGRLSWWGMPDTPVALDLNHASVGPIGDDRGSWPWQRNLKLDGFVYSRFADGPTDSKSRLEWLNRQRPRKFKPQPFQQLAKVLREDGDNVGARRVLVAMEDQRRKYGKLNFPAWIWRWILKLAIGYGYRPWYALLWGLAIVTLAAGSFGRGYSINAVTPTDKEAYQIFETHHPKLGYHGYPPWYYVEFSPVVYSLDTFLPIINLGEKDHWMPNPHEGSFGEFLRVYLWIHIGLGWLLTTLFVAGLTPIVRSG